jgi:hypothetical protein
MANIKPGRYSDLPKGYLTYPIKKGNINSLGIIQVLLKEAKHKTSLLVFPTGEKCFIHTRYVELFKKRGIPIETIETHRERGRKKLTVTIDGLTQEVPIEVHRVNESGDIKEIQIRITAQTEGELIKRISAVQQYLSAWNIKPKECVWSQGGWQEATDLFVSVDKEKLSKEMERINKIKKKNY